MKLTIESTEVIEHVDGVPCRVWKATTAGGIECVVLVHRIAVRRECDATEFERELREQAPPRSALDFSAQLPDKLAPFEPFDEVAPGPFDDED